MPSGSVASVAGSVAGGLLGAKSSKSASKAQSAAIKEQVEEDRRQYDQNREDTAPYRNVGQQAILSLADLLGLNARAAPVAPTRADFTEENKRVLNPAYQTAGGRFGGGPTPFGPGVPQYIRQDVFDSDGYNRALEAYNTAQGDYESFEPSGELLKKFTLEDFEEDPGYQFRLNEGNKAIGRSGAGRVFNSGGTMKDFLRYGQDYASNEFNNAYNRDASEKDRIYNYLSGAAGTGQSSTAQLINTNTGISNNIGNAYANAGNVRAAGIVGANNAIGQGVGNAVNAFQFNKFLDAYNEG